MQTYQPYFQPQAQPTMMNPYQNFSQQQNPYMDRMAQLQQYQQSLQPQVQQQSQQIGLNCRIVDDFNSIVANDVPMDGNGAFFAKRDGSEIQHRNWSSNGTIQTTVYKPVQQENSVEATNIPQNDFNALNEDVRALRDDILARLDAIEKSISKPGTRAKKAEVNADE